MNVGPVPLPAGSPDLRPGGQDVAPRLVAPVERALHCAPLYSTRYPPSMHLSIPCMNCFSLLSCENTFLYFTNRKNSSNDRASTSHHQRGPGGTSRSPGHTGARPGETGWDRYGRVGLVVVVVGAPRRPRPDWSPPGWVGGAPALGEPSGASVVAVVVVGIGTGSYRKGAWPSGSSSRSTEKDDSIEWTVIRSTPIGRWVCGSK